MILPTKHLELDKSLLAIGGLILEVLRRPRTVTSTWEEARKSHQGLTFESFAHALALLYSIGAVDMTDELLRSARR
jgi:hypothetical protein